MTTTTRQRLDLDHGWSFSKGRVPPRRFDVLRLEGEKVDLPHCWNGRDTFQLGVDYYRGPGTYLRTFSLPDSSWTEDGHRVVLVSEGFYGLAEIFLDRRRLARIDGQYLGFRLDLSEHLRDDADHELAIRVTNRCPRHVLPGTSKPDFVLFGGLAGRLGLERVPAAHLRARESRITARDVLTERAVLDLALPFQAPSGLAEGRSIRALLRGPQGSVVAEGRSEAVAAGEAVLRLEVGTPKLWSPESPTLYQLEWQLVDSAGALDGVSRRIGFRHVHFDERGFHLNGTPYELHGFNRHESVPGLGPALPERFHRKDAELLKTFGANFVRLSHYPQHPIFLDACDELGLFVYAELASWKTARGGRWRRAALHQMREMLLRDRHRPSSLFWGMGNEAQHGRTYRAVAALIHELDPERPATYAESHFYRGERAGLVGLPDVWSTNYDIDSMARQHRASRSGAVLVSECCNDQALRGDLDQEIEQARKMIELWRSLEGRPYLVGFALWSLADYPTLFRRRYTRHTGKFDAWRQPKLSAWLFRARHGPRPFVKLLGNWHLDGPSKRRVAVVSSEPMVRIELAGETFSVATPDGLGVREVSFRPSSLTALVGSEEGGAQDALEPWGPARRIVVTAAPEHLSASDRDWSEITFRVEDEGGRLVRDWQGGVALEVEGPLRLFTYRPDDHVLVSRGEGIVYARSEGRAGQARLRARHSQLEDGHLELRTVDR